MLVCGLTPAEDPPAERAGALTDNDDRLALDPDLKIPRYVSAIDNHCAPGSYYAQAFDGDVAVAASYDAGFYVTFGLQTGPGEALADWLAEHKPDFRPRRILDLGTTIGHNLLPLARLFPEAEIIAVDVGAPALRYGLARAKSLGVDNIRFVQADATDLPMFEDGSFDLVMSCILLHEMSHPALHKVMGEAHRLLKPGGLTLHLDMPPLNDRVPLFLQAVIDWDAFYNNEPFMSTLRDADVFDYLAGAGFGEEGLFHAAPFGYKGGVGGDLPIASGEGRAPPEFALTMGLQLYGATR